MKSRQHNIEDSNTFHWSSNSLSKLIPERVAILRKHLKGENALDLGCAQGAYTDFVRSLGFCTIGLDISTDLLTAASRRFQQSFFILGDCTRLCFSDASFDNVIAFDLIEHVDDDLLLTEVCRVCRGTVILSFPLRYHETLGRNGLIYWHYQDHSHLRYYELAAMPALLSRPGLRQIESIEVDPVDLASAFINSLDYSSITRRIIGKLIRALRIRKYPQTLIVACAVLPR